MTLLYRFGVPDERESGNDENGKRKDSYALNATFTRTQLVRLKSDGRVADGVYYDTVPHLVIAPVSRSPDGTITASQPAKWIQPNGWSSVPDPYLG